LSKRHWRLSGRSSIFAVTSFGSQSRMETPMRQSMRFSTFLMILSTVATIYMIIADSRALTLIHSIASSAASH
jgi:hypothetical protein